MSDEQARVLGERSLAFMGGITAGVSHEMNNVLSIINEYSGLLNDLVVAQEKGRPIRQETLARLSQGISNQIKRGEQEIKRLNRFAHSVDQEITAINLTALLDDITGLTQRSMNAKGSRLETAFPDEFLTLHGNPFLLQQAISLCMDIAMAPLEKGDTMSVSYERLGDGAQIRIQSPRWTAGDDGDTRQTLLATIMNELRAKLETDGDEGETGSFIISVHSRA